MTCPEKTFMMNLTDTLIRQNYIDFFTVILICQCPYRYFFKLVEYILRNTENRKYLIEALFVHVTDVILCYIHTHTHTRTNTHTIFELFYLFFFFFFYFPVHQWSPCSLSNVLSSSRDTVDLERIGLQVS